MEQTRSVNAIRFVAIVFLLATSLYGCGGIPSAPTAAEHRDRLAGAGLSATSRFAVVSRASQVHDITPYPLERSLIPKIEAITEQQLGIQAEGLQQIMHPGWYEELKRARKEVGWFSAARGYEEFFRQQGYDGYILITLFQWEQSRQKTAAGIQHYNAFVIGRGLTHYYTYSPVFHIVHLPKGGEKSTLAIVNPIGRFGCDLVTVGDQGKDGNGTESRIRAYTDVEGCAQRIAAEYSAGLGRLAGQ